MPELNIKVFSTAIDVLTLFASGRIPIPVWVVETERTLGLRPFIRDASVGLVIPKARQGSRGLSYTRTEMALDDDTDGIPLGAFLDVKQLKLRLRAMRTQRRRGDTTLGEVIFDNTRTPMALEMYDPGSYQPVVATVSWSNDPQPPRLPVYLGTTSAGNRISASTLDALGKAGRKLSPTAVWTVSDGRWEMQSTEGSTLRVATWPTNT